MLLMNLFINICHCREIPVCMSPLGCAGGSTEFAPFGMGYPDLGIGAQAGFWAAGSLFTGRTAHPGANDGTNLSPVIPVCLKRGINRQPH